jgi:hypothetical protein
MFRRWRGHEQREREGYRSSARREMFVMVWGSEIPLGRERERDVGVVDR